MSSLIGTQNEFALIDGERPVYGEKILQKVKLLRDGKGIYGIEGSCFPNCDNRYSTPNRLILRPDKLREFEDEDKNYNSIVYQMIKGGFRHGMFKRSLEEQLRKEIHRVLLNRSGLPWPPPGGPNGELVNFWSNDKSIQLENRRKFHGLRLISLNIVNGLIFQALHEAAPLDIVKTTRRFRFRHREEIYRAAARSNRAHQLIETFPVLGLAIYRDDGRPKPDETPFPKEYAIKLMHEWEKCLEGREMVERGAPLKHIAELMEVPVAFRHIKSGAVDLVGLDAG